MIKKRKIQNNVFHGVSHIIQIGAKCCCANISKYYCEVVVMNHHHQLCMLLDTVPYADNILFLKSFYCVVTQVLLTRIQGRCAIRTFSSLKT